MQYSYNNSTTTKVTTNPYITGTITTGTGTITIEPNTYTSTIGTFDPNIITTSKATVTTKNEITMKQKPYCRIEEIVPEKVYKFHFRGSVIKTVCAEEDEFSLEYAYYLAEAKRHKDMYTFEGVLQRAEEFQQMKSYNKHCREAIRLFKEEQKEKRKEEELKEIKKRRHEKYIAKKLKRKEKKRQEQIDIIREAIKGE